MAECFICGETLIDNNGKSACLKIYREMDKKELSINFDNSLNAFGDKCKRIEACVFTDEYAANPEKTVYIEDSKKLADVIFDFVNNKGFYK